MTVHLTDLNAAVDLLLKRIPGTLRIGAPGIKIPGIAFDLKPKP